MKSLLWICIEATHTFINHYNTTFSGITILNIGDPFIQITLIIIVNVAAILAVEISVYRIKRNAPSSRNNPQLGWKEKLGIETTQDLLIFCVIICVTLTVLMSLALAGLGYIVPLPY